jgi:hypothetical protein
MSQNEKKRQLRERWLNKFDRGEHPFQIAERSEDLEYLAFLREQGLIEMPYPKKTAVPGKPVK